MADLSTLSGTAYRDELARRLGRPVAGMSPEATAYWQGQGMSPTPVQPAPPPAPYQAPPAAPQGAPLTSEQQSAKALITGTLNAWGLGALGEWMWQEYMNGNPL